MKYVMVLFAATLASAKAPDMSLFQQAQSRESQGWHNGVYDAVIEKIRKAGGFKHQAKDWDLSEYQLLHSLRYVVGRARIEGSQGPMLKSRFGFDVPAGLFSTFHDQLKTVYMKDFGFADEIASSIADVPEQEVVEVSRIHYEDYLKALGRPAFSEETMRRNLLIALESLSKSTQVIDNRYDVPFVAGYDVNNEKYIFVDRSVPEFFQGKKGPIPVWRFLNLHERIEKAVLDAFQVNYQTAHQIALRTEHRSAWAVDIQWKSYNFPMGGLIDKLGDKRPTSVSNRIDMVPYYSYSDKDSVQLVREMLDAMVADP